MFTLIIRDRNGTERTERFSEKEVVIGRVPGNSLVLRAGNVSRQHARITVAGVRLTITDLGSANGTYVNSRRIRQTTILRDGDEIWVGDFQLQVEIPSPESSIFLPGRLENKWYVFTSPDGTEGPLTTSQICARIRAGSITQKSQVCMAGSGRWQRVGSVDVFAELAKSAGEETAHSRVTPKPTEAPSAPLIPANASNVYWYVINGDSDPFGPFTTAQVRAGIRTKQIPITAQLNRAGTPDWFDLPAIPEFAEDMLRLGR